ncbi:MAG: S9 family peptidase, partial [Thermoanaerobaculia bacterium]|nr:S9 family peptidase [Thermoanaerobaculia bacterium]
MQSTTLSRRGRSTKIPTVELALAAFLLSLVLVPASAFADATAPQAPAEAASAEPLSYLDRLPQLVDRQLFFGDPEITGSQISPDGKYLTFIKPYKDVQNVWIKTLDEPWDAARPVTADERPVPGYFWSEDSKWLLYVQDKGGNEDFHVYAVDPSAGPEEATGVPPARDLTPLEGVRAFIYSVPEATPGQILIGLNDRDPALHDVYRLDLATGERELLIENDSNVAGWVTDLDGNVRLAVRQTPDGGTETVKVQDGKLGDVIYSCNWQETCAPNRFHKDGKHVYFISNKGDDVDLSRLYLMDAETGETKFLESDPENEVDLGGAIFSDETEELIGTVYVGDRTRTYPKTQELKDALAFLEKELPDGEISFSPQTNDDRLVKVVVSRDVDPGTVYLYDWEKGTVEKLYESRPELPSENLAPMQAIRYTARDGLTIPAYLTTPKGAPAKNLATVVLPHGGPWSRNSWGYSSIPQFLANRGYAVLSPNFRSSSGFGKKFLNAGNKEWGRAMQHDISDGVKYLVDQGIADPDRVCIMGGSYGGYATLAGLTFTPELYACGVDIVGPSNLITLYNSLPAYWGPIVRIFALRMGDPEIDEEREMLVDRSPLTHVERIEDPLLVIQGANDPRVKKAEADQIVIAMREKGL